MPVSHAGEESHGHPSVYLLVPWSPTSLVWIPLIGASVSEPLPSDVNMDFVCLWTGVRMAWQRCMRLIFCTWQYMLLWLFSFVRA